MAEQDNNHHTPGRRLKSRRALEGLTQEQLAQAAGVSVSRLSAWENNRGIERMRVGLLVGLCDVLRCPLDYIVHGEKVDAAP